MSVDRRERCIGLGDDGILRVELDEGFDVLENIGVVFNLYSAVLALLPDQR